MSKISRYSGSKFEDSLKLILPALEWAEKQDVERLRRFLVENANIPLYCISSGGSSSANDYLSLLYETNQGMSKSLTPLMMTSISDEALKRAKILIMSGEGHGTDECYTVPRAASVNPKGVCGISRKNDDGKNIVVNTLKKVTTNWFLYHWAKQNAFIATNSTIAKFALYYKAFTDDDDIVSKLDLNLTPEHSFTYKPRVEGDIPSIRDLKNYIVLYNGWSRPVAQDFESKMIECGIASVQMCDYRNFCHGRFIFLSRHLEDSALVLFVTPREKEFVRKLILEGKTFRGQRDVFPKNTAIMTIETELDNPLASIDLLIKMQVCFNEIAKACRLSDKDDPCNPDNPNGINKEFPRSLDWGNMATMKPLGNDYFQGSNGTMRNVSRKKVINYDPKKNVEQLAKSNGVTVPTIRKYIRDKHIDRKRDEKMLAYNMVWKEYIKDSDQSFAAMAKKLKMSPNTIRQYLDMEAKDIVPEEGKIGMASEDKNVKKLREAIPGLQKRFERFSLTYSSNPNLSPSECLKKLGWKNDSKGDNLSIVTSFMQMKEFKYKFREGKVKLIQN